MPPLPKLRPAPAPAFDPFVAPVVTRLDEDPDFIRENALLAAFRARDIRRREELERLAREGETVTAKHAPSPMAFFAACGVDSSRPARSISFRSSIATYV